MNRQVNVLIAILIGWIILSSFWYTCKIKGQCFNQKKEKNKNFVDEELAEENMPLKDSVFVSEIDTTTLNKQIEDSVSNSARETLDQITENNVSEPIAHKDVAPTPPKVPCPKVNTITAKPTITDVQFGYASDGIYCTVTLRKFAKAAKAYLEENGGVIEIIGHTDNGPKSINNFTLGLKRAISIKKFLIKEGISAEMIKTNSKANTEPIGDNNTPEGRRLNRRASITIK